MDYDSRWCSIFTKKLEIEVRQAFLFFRNYGLEPMLIKGWAAARYYPPSFPRFYSDIDLSFSTEEYPNARALIEQHREINFSVDLHCELRHLDTSPWSLLLANSIEVDLDGVGIRVPSHEDHLRILVVHWLTDGGAFKEKLWDIFYAVENRPEGFDWNKCLNCVSEVRRDWIIATIGIASKYLGLDVDGLPFALKAKSIPAWLISALEAEWSSDVKLQSLMLNLYKPRDLIKQIRKRIPPNPIQATVEMEGRFDDGPRLGYQVRNMIRRTPASVRGIARALKHRN